MSRNGRSSSQISIDNYPEHLNPFYEDDNHKRLRFWNLKKKSSDKGGRRSSFSIENLRDIWTFKSFSLKKKSSTLGINKTSESPPLLRRQLNEPSECNNFLSARDRYSEAGTSPMRNELNLSYRRPYRSSLQHIDATSENGSLGNAFNRNDMYRATTQSVGYLTPNFRRNHQTRLSQSSLSSTNPFESDVETNIDSISTTSRKSYRKKRRAPLPPPRSTIHNDAHDETTTTDNTNGNIDIKSLTSEIEQFVNITNESLDKPDPTAKSDVHNCKTSTTNNFIKSSADANNTRVVYVESASPPHSEVSLHIDENRNVCNTESLHNETSKDEISAAAKREEPLADLAQKVENLPSRNKNHLSPTSLPETDRMQDEIQLPRVQKLENKSATTSDHINNHSKVVNEPGSPQTQSVLNKKKKAQDHELEITKESLTNQIIDTSTTKESKTSDNIILTKPEINPKPKIGKTYESLTDHAREDTTPWTQKVVIKTSLSKTESSNNDLDKDAVQKHKLSSTNGTATEQTMEEKSPIKSILQNTKTSSKPNILFIEEQPASTVSITKHKNLTSKELSQDLPMPSSLSPKNPQTEMLSSSWQKNGFYSQENKFYFNGGNGHQLSTTFNERLHQNDEPIASTSKGNESNDAHQAGKKKSVREVIESINRSQRMLNESIAKGTKIYSTPLFVEHKNTHSNELNSLNLKSTQKLETKNITVNTVSSNEVSIDPQPSVFHKSKINKMVCDYRESSPTASNLDWNPLPKPKRTNNA